MQLNTCIAHAPFHEHIYMCTTRADISLSLTYAFLTLCDPKVLSFHLSPQKESFFIINIFLLLSSSSNGLPNINISLGILGYSLVRV